MMSTGAKILTLLREAMRQHSIGALIVPSSDPHNSEYVRDDYKCRAFITNFRGSAGTCLVTMDAAYLWTDGRYWLEASKTMYPEWKLMEDGKPDVPSLEEWVRLNLGAATPVGMNSSLSTVAQWEKRRHDMNLVAVPELVRPLMPPPALPPAKIFHRPPEYCGKTCEEKLASIFEELEKQKCDVMILSALDEVAWLTNLRGSDVPFNPIFYAYAVVQRGLVNIHLFVDPAKVPTDDLTHVIKLHMYDELEAFLAGFPSGTSFLVDEYQTSQWLFEVLKKYGMQTQRVKCGPAQRLKAIKNSVEIEGFRRCHVRDGVALTRYLALIYNAVAVDGNTNISEYDGAERLEAFRREEEHFVQMSFETISSVGSNAAIIHYSPPRQGSAKIALNELYLVDSGAQYLDGTTDVTRTICFQTPKPEEREGYTLVLKGHIALHCAVWPRGTSGHRLDALARVALWQCGLDYAHGTGHGVGSFLNVHEGPQGIGTRPTPTEATLEEGMIISNEPGYYKDGAFGIRIENLDVIVPTTTKHSPTGFFTCDTLTMVPLCYDMIDVTLLTESERQWVNGYNAKVREALEPGLKRHGDNLALEYLKYHTKSI